MKRYPLLLLGVLAALLPASLFAQDAAPPLTRVGYEDMQAVIAESEAPLTVVNFWATWCVPCREEFPYFVQLGREFGEEVEVFFVSMDFDDQYGDAQAFLVDQGVESESYFKQGKDHAFINAFSEDWSGAIPATFMYASGGELVTFWEGKITHDELQEKVRHTLAELPQSSN